MFQPERQSISMALIAPKSDQYEVNQTKKIDLSDQEEKIIENKIRAIYQESSTCLSVFLQKKLVSSKDKSLKINAEELSDLTVQALQILKEKTPNTDTVYSVGREKMSYCLLTQTERDLSYCLQLFKLVKKSEKKAESWTLVMLLSTGEKGYLRIISNSKHLFDQLPQQNQNIFRTLYKDQPHEGILPTTYFSKNKKKCYQIYTGSCLLLRDYFETECVAKKSEIKKLINNLFTEVYNLHAQGYALRAFDKGSIYINKNKPVLIDFKYACPLPAQEEVVTLQQEQNDKLSKSKVQKTTLNLSVLSSDESPLKLIQEDYAWLAYVIASTIKLVKNKQAEKQEGGKVKAYSITLYPHSRKLNNFIKFLAEAKQKITPAEFEHQLTAYHIPSEIQTFLKAQAVVRSI